MKQNLFKKIKVNIELNNVNVDHVGPGFDLDMKTVKKDWEYICQGIKEEISKYLYDLDVILEKTDQFQFTVSYVNENGYYCGEDGILSLYAKIDNLVTNLITNLDNSFEMDLIYDVTFGDSYWD